MNVAALGTAISFAKFIFLPHKADGEEAVKARFLASSEPATRWLVCGKRGLLRGV
jgi:hypothetical protein